MKNEWLIRTEILLGKENLEKLQKSQVTIVGLGGVGSYAAEALVRAGIGEFFLIDHDKVSESNLNRQILATRNTIGRYKTEIMKNRMLEINPDVKVDIFSDFLNKDNRLEILSKSDYVLDAIDSLSPKMGLIKDLCILNKYFISVIGAGNRIDPEKIKITTISQTEGCPFAKRLRKLLKRNGVVTDFPVVFSYETNTNVVPNSDWHNDTKPTNATTDYIPKSIVGSISYIPAIMGMMAAGGLVREIIKK